MALGACRSDQPADLKLVDSFGTGGVAEIRVGETARATDLAVADGSIFVAGESDGGPRGDGDLDFFVAKLTENGRPDEGFGAGGHTVVQADGAAAWRLILQPDGKIVVVGSTSRPNAVSLIRLTSGGQLDASFGQAGRADSDFSHTIVSADAAFADGRVFLAAQLDNGTAVLRRFELDGSASPGFGEGGSLTFQSEDSSVVAGRDGAVYVATANLADRTTRVWRVDTSGRRDSAFGDGGATTIDAHLRLADVAPDGTPVATFGATPRGNKIGVVMLRHGTKLLELDAGPIAIKDAAVVDGDVFISVDYRAGSVTVETVALGPEPRRSDAQATLPDRIEETGAIARLGRGVVVAGQRRSDSNDPGARPVYLARLGAE